MIITNEHASKAVSTFGGKKIKYAVSPEAMGPIMSILSRQYSDTSLAPIREYTTNGIDAQVEAGWERPVEITRPSVMNPIFKVQDFGVGMDAATIEEVYSFYGASTKSKSNDYNGSMGIGSKSAFAYTNQFTVVGIKDGIKTTVIISRDEEGGGDLEIVAETPTDEHNGTTVSFTVYNVSTFNDRITTFAQAMAPGLLLVDGEDLSQWHTYKKIVGTVRDSKGNVVINAIYHTDKIPYSYADPSDKIYMGGIAYPALVPLTSVRPVDRRNLLVDVPLGTVKFTPSRESLEDMPSTKAVHQLIEKVYVENLKAAVLSDIAASGNLIEAYNNFSGNKNIIGSDSATYKGTALNLLGSETYNHTAFHWTLTDSGTGTAYSNHYHRSQIIADNNIIYVTGFPMDTATGVASSYKKKFVHWFNNVFVPPVQWRSDDTLTTVIFTDKKPDGVDKHPLMSLASEVSFDDIKAIRLPRKPSQAGTRTSMGGKHEVFTDGGWDMLYVDDLDGKDVHYVIGADFKRELINSGDSTLHGDASTTFAHYMVRHRSFLGDKAVIVNLYASRRDKFLRDLGRPAKYVGSPHDVTSAWAEDKLKELTPERARSAALYSSNRGTLRAVARAFNWVRGAKPLDPLLAKALEDEGEYFDVFHEFRGTPYIYRQRAESIINAAGKELEREREAVMACYPLLSVIYYGNINSAETAQAVIDYINNTYTANNNDGGKNAV